MNGIAKYEARALSVNSLLCVGLDSDTTKIPTQFANPFEFNKWIIDQTHPYVCAYKPNMAFYEALGAKGWDYLIQTVDYIRSNHPDIFTICDAKRADIGNTNMGYVRAIFDELGFDAITLHPYLGKEALAPFLERQDKVSIILCRTSNPESGEFQNMMVGDKPLWRVIAERVATDWNTHHNCMLVMGATYPEEFAGLRDIIGDMPLLIPGIGAQGGNLAGVMRHGIAKNDLGLIINASRSIIFAQNPAYEARTLQAQINGFRAHTTC
jgi:orotidine-5'-phosphate decarboxylase